MQKTQLNKLQRRLARAPVFLLLALAFLLCKPLSAQAKQEPLSQNMKEFQHVQCYKTIQTSGEVLNSMFDYDYSLDEKKQYIAVYMIDKEKSSDIGWYTHMLYAHKQPWGTVIPDDQSDVLFKLNLSKKSKSKTFGKVGFYHYSDKYGGRKKYVGDGKVGTLFYFCTDTGTTYGDAIEAYRNENKANKKNSEVKIYLSPVIGESKKGTHTGILWNSLSEWEGAHAWANDSTFDEHYDVPLLFEMHTIKVVYRSYEVGKLLTSKSEVLYSANAQQLQFPKKNPPRKLEKTDYIFSPGDLLELTDSKGKKLENPVVEYEEYSKKSFALTNPVSAATNTANNYVVTQNEEGYTEKQVCVGYRIFKVRKDGTKVILAASMIEMKKTETGEYKILTVDDKNGTSTEVDTEPDGTAMSAPTVTLDSKVTVMRYNKYKKTSTGKLEPTGKLAPGKEITLRKWLNNINKVTYWCASPEFGIGGKNVNYDKDELKAIYVDWFYSPIDSNDYKITLQQYYTTETTNIETKEIPSVDDSADLSYTHTSNKHEAQTPIVLDTVNYGDPWVSYDVMKADTGQYLLKDGSVSPVRQTTEDGSGTVSGTATSAVDSSFEDVNPTCDFTKKDLINIPNSRNGLPTARIPYILDRTSKGAKFESTGNNYLYRVVIKTDKDDVWTEFTAEDIWGKTVPANGKIVKGKSTNRSYTTNAPYMRTYVYQTKQDALGLIKSKNADWQLDAYNMTHFIIPSVRCDITIEAYYTTTVPVRTFVYQQDSSGKFILQESETKTAWVSAGVNYYGTYDGPAAAVIAGTGRKASSTPYVGTERRKRKFDSVSAAEKYYPDRIKCQTTTSDFTIKVKTEPVTVCIFIEVPTNKYFTQAQYVHTQDGAYHLLKSWKQPIRNIDGPMTCPGHPSKYGTWYHTYLARTVKAFVSFPEYVSYDDGNTGLYGSLYSGQGIDFEYDQDVTLPQVTYTKPGRYHTGNNSIIYLTEAGHLAQDDCVNPIPGGDNSLVCYMIYEDYFGWWENSQYNPENGTKNPHVEEKEALTWNWILPDGFVWESSDICGEDTVDETVYDKLFSNEFISQVLTTQGSARYQAQTAVPTTDVLRTITNVPRYVTKGYWNRHKLSYSYDVNATYVTQHKSSRTIMSGDNSNNDNDPVYCSFDYYYSDPVQWKTSTTVTRRSVYYTLGDAEVWDPQRVELTNDVFSDTTISRDGVVTLYGNGRNGGFESNARFFKTGDGAYQMPTLYTKRQYVNYGTYNDWEESSSVNDDLKYFDEDADGIIGSFLVKNDTVSFFDGIKTTYVLASGQEGLKKSVKIPSFPPEADFTYTGVFDSRNNVPEGIVVEPEINNGHHETCTVVFYRQVQCIPTDEYKTNELIKSKIIDDGDDDVMVYTPTYNESMINLDYNSVKTNAAGVRLNPLYNFDQSTSHELGQSLHNIQLDREYTMTLSVVGTASHLQGYGYQDYVRYLELDDNGVPCTQVKFPFPVQMVVRELKNNQVVEDDRYYYANEWIRLEMIDEQGNVVGKINQTFFVPSWATEDESATIYYRSLARNCKANDPRLEMKNPITNDDFVDESLQVPTRHNAIEERDYIATNKEIDTVTGRISSFQIIDVTDYPAWEPVFREYDRTLKRYTTAWSGVSYHSGVSNEFGFTGSWGSKYTTPVVGASNPAGASVGTIGLGYKFRYKLTTVGPYYNLTDTVKINPTFYFMNDAGEYLQKDGTYSTSTFNRAEVQVYYSETFNGSRHELVRVGSEQDSHNKKSLNITDDVWSISKSRIDFTNNILNSSKAGMTETQYTFDEIAMTAAMRLVDGDNHVSAHIGNYLDTEANTRYDFNSSVYSILSEYESHPERYAGTAYEELAAQLTSTQIARSVQTWYGEYYLPSEVYATSASWDTVKRQIKNGFDGSEDCWLKGGRLVINFNPRVVSETKQDLKYDRSELASLPTSSGVEYDYAGCNQFRNENCVTAKMLSTGEVLTLKSGDVIIYDKLTGNTGEDTRKAKSAKDIYNSSGSH